MENTELNLIPEKEIEVSKGHYEALEEVTKKVPIFDEDGNITGFDEVVTGRKLKWVWDDPEELKKQQIAEQRLALKAELAKIKEDIEQETFGLVRDDYAEKKARAAEIINELRILEGKEPRKIKSE